TDDLLCSAPRQLQKRAVGGLDPPLAAEDEDTVRQLIQQRRGPAMDAGVHLVIGRDPLTLPDVQIASPERGSGDRREFLYVPSGGPVWGGQAWGNPAGAPHPATPQARPAPRRSPRAERHAAARAARRAAARAGEWLRTV